MVVEELVGEETPRTADSSPSPRYGVSRFLRIHHINLPLAVVFSLGGAVVVVAIAASVLADLLIVGTRPTPPADLTRLALTVAAGVGGVVALVVAYRRQRYLEQGRFTEAFGAAAKQLGDADVAVRLAGVYAMAGVADQASGLKSQQCIDVLCGYLRLPYSPEQGNNHQSGLVVREPVLGKEGSEQELHFQYRQNDKVVRQTIVRVINDHLRWAAPQSWSFNNFDFSDTYFEAADFSSANFSGKTQFSYATFSGFTLFHHATFNGPTWFNSATFNGLTLFDSAKFNGMYIRFNNAAFNAKVVSFDKATFTGEETSFVGVRFGGDRITFRQVDFGDGRVTFEDPRAWSPATVFDWDVKNGPVVLQPANVEPKDWPPHVGKGKL